MRRGLALPLALLALAVVPVRPALAQDEGGADLRAKVTFVAERSVYLSIGSDAGVDVGAEVLLLRGGRLRIEAVSTRSSVATTVELAGEIRPGDVVLLRVRRVPAPEREQGEAPGAPFGPPDTADVEDLWVRIEAAPAQKVPFRERAEAPPAATTPAEGAAPVGSAAEERAPGRAAAEPPRDNVVHGSVTVGWTGMLPQGGLRDRAWHLPRGSATLSIERLGGENLTFRFNGDASALFQASERKDRAGRSHDYRLSVSELSLTWLPDAVPLRLSIGRTLACDAAPVGLVDGARAGLRVGSILEVGGFGGLDPSPSFDERSRTKLGAYATFRTPESQDAHYELSIAYARTTEKGALDRQLLALDTRASVLDFISAYGMAELDLTAGTANPWNRPALDLTSLTVGVRLRPVRFLDVGFSWDRRRPFLGRRELADLAPATVSLLDQGVFQSYRGDVRVDFPLSCWLRAFLDVRVGGSGATTVGGEVGCDSLFGAPLRVSGGGTAFRARLGEGITLFGRAELVVLGDLTVRVGYTLSVDQPTSRSTFALGSPGRTLRHEARLGLDYAPTSCLSFDADATYAVGGGLGSSVVLSASATLRF